MIGYYSKPPPRCDCAGFQEVLRPLLVHDLVGPLPAAELSDANLSATILQHDPDPLLRRIIPHGPPLDLADHCLRICLFRDGSPTRHGSPCAHLVRFYNFMTMRLGGIRMFIHNLSKNVVRKHLAGSFVSSLLSSRAAVSWASREVP